MYCTIYKDIFTKDQPNYILVDTALARIREGKSRAKVEEIRAALDKEKAQDLKKQLPSVCFSGKFTERKDNCIIEHSGFLVLDFDNVDDLGTKAAEIASKPYVYAIWVSPSGNGLKALIRIAEGKKHREHFAALKEIFPDADSSGVNESRVCYESYDPTMVVNAAATPFAKVNTYEKIEAVEVVADERAIFQNLLKWQSNKGGAFVKGERNIFIFKLAGACCRYGIWENSAIGLILSEFPASNEFTTKEATNTIKSAYRANAASAGSARFEKGLLVDKVTRREIDVPAQEFDMSEPPKDIIYSATVKENAIELWRRGYKKVSGIGVPAIDGLHKSKKGELTALTGIGNYGKSTWDKWRRLMRILLYAEKFVVFCPEDNPPEEYYNDYVEMLLGCNCVPTNFDGTPNLNQPRIENISNAYDFIGKHIFYLYPKEETATLDYILERFLEMVIKEKVDGCCIDPWNQVLHDYQKYGTNVSKYLENSLGRIARFAQNNSVYMDLIVHPKIMSKQANGNYECPDKFDINDGAMWNNKVDNLLVYHRPFAQSDPKNPTCEFHSKKIRRQKTVGKLGVMASEYKMATRRYEIDGKDYMQELINLNQLDFHAPIPVYVPKSTEAISSAATKFNAGFQNNFVKPPANFWNEPN